MHHCSEPNTALPHLLTLQPYRSKAGVVQGGTMLMIKHALIPERRAQCSLLLQVSATALTDPEALSVSVTQQLGSPVRACCGAELCVDKSSAPVELEELLRKQETI